MAIGSSIGTSVCHKSMHLETVVVFMFSSTLSFFLLFCLYVAEFVPNKPANIRISIFSGLLELPNKIYVFVYVFFLLFLIVIPQTFRQIQQMAKKKKNEA